MGTKEEGKKIKGSKNSTSQGKKVVEQEFISGTLHTIPRDPLGEFPRVTLAAGAVLWRGSRLDPEFAVIHRPHYDDWSLPKGKVDPDESLVGTVAREIKEETGFDVRLEELLGKVTYPVKGRTKVVYYWIGEAVGSEFEENKEVDELRWLDLDSALELLTYDVDINLLRTAAQRMQEIITTRVLYVRHARAHDRKNWSGDDNLRPLDKKGRRQAEMLVPLLLPYEPTAIYAAVPDRCHDTAAPLADELGLNIGTDLYFGDDGWDDSKKKSQELFTSIVARGGTPVIVAQGHIIPEMLRAIAPEIFAEEELKAKKGSVWVLSFAGEKLVAADYLASPLPLL
ncbi:MAG: bifunctional NUDIX hydrolase/histidine phosphatase family protein [Corynebacterium sp.]|nr:bifunctional NUDIX hydrolase/histidine phosphatase family protein [Corynebacterium sp.]